jgi:hypothetical protein
MPVASADSPIEGVGPRSEARAAFGTSRRRLATSETCEAFECGVLQTAHLDRGCFACMLGSADGRTLFMMAAEWRGPADMFDDPATGQVLIVAVAVPEAGWP